MKLSSMSELATELEVSNSAITKFVARNGLGERLVRDGNKKLVPDDVAEEIRAHFSSTTKADIAADTKLSQARQEIASLQAAIASMQSTIDANVATIKELRSSLDSVSQSLDKTNSSLQEQIALNTSMNTTIQDLMEINKALSASNALLQAKELEQHKEQEEALATIEAGYKADKRPGLLSRLLTAIKG